MEKIPFKKMTGTEFALFCLMAVASGVIIGIGGVSSLVANARLGEWGKLIGAILFSLGIFAIVSFEMKLFTGMVADIPTLGFKNSWQLPVCFICNAFGVAVAAALAYYSPASEILLSDAGKVVENKLNVDDWAIRALCSSILCGMLITISVKARFYAPQKGLSPTTGVILPIIVFAFCGFDHSVANMLYFYYLGEASWRVTGYILLTILGNTVGGLTLPVVSLLRGKAMLQ